MIGLIAQEAYLVYSPMVKKGDDGNISSRFSQSVWGLDNSKPVPILIRELQELRKRVLYLENKQVLD